METIINHKTILAILLFAVSFYGCNSVQNSYIAKVKNEFQSQPLEPEEILKESELSHLPPAVKKYILYTGAVSKNKIQNVRIEFDELMYRKPNGPALPSSSDQYNFYKKPARLFFMKASLFGIPFRVLHAYSEEKATMLVRVASLFNAVDLKGEDLSSTETVTILNDMCFFAPSALIDKRLTWKEIDPKTVQVTFQNGVYQAVATLYFNDKFEIINFIAEDRKALQDDGTLKKVRWSTPLKDYKDINGIMVPTYGEAIYHYPEGDFKYGIFMLKNIHYNVKEYREE